jgi:hypothetical protein
MGSVAHQRHQCFCCTGHHDRREENMTLLDSAIASHEEFKLRHGHAMRLDW